MTNAMAALSPFFGPGQATLLGRPERADILHAALLNGISSHVLDFDDTHIETAIHPAAPVAPAILALAEHRPVSGRDFMAALVVGIETELPHRGRRSRRRTTRPAGTSPARPAFSAAPRRPENCSA